MMKKLFLPLFLLLILKVSAQTTDRLYTPNGILYHTIVPVGIGINEDKPAAALHIRQPDDQGTALRIDMHSMIQPVDNGGNNTYTNPKYALTINRFSDGVPGSPLIPLVSILAKGAITRIGYFGVGNERLMVGNSLAVYESSSGKIGLDFNSNSNPELIWTSSSNKNFHFQNTATNAISLTLSPGGKVGIGTDNFSTDNDLAVGGGTITEGLEIQSVNNWGSDNDIIRIESNDPTFSWQSQSNANLEFASSSQNILVLSPDGKVGINTDDFFDNHNFYVGGSVYIHDDGEEVHSLYIEGSSIAEEMFVKLKADWPDYVFHQDYSLMPLADLEAYIDQNGRLPQMPTAAEVAKEGIATGETLHLLTQKVEELTLYILQQQKEIDALKEEMNQN